MSERATGGREVRRKGGKAGEKEGSDGQEGGREGSLERRDEGD